MNYLKRIENSNNVNDVCLKKTPFWPLLRMEFYISILKKDALSKGDAPYQKNKLALIKSIFYGYRNWFKKYDYMAFSDTSERKRMNNKYQNKLLDFIIDEVGNDKVLLVEDANPYHLKLHEVYTKRIVSFSGIKVLIYALKMLIKTFKIKIKIDGTEVLDKIKNDNNLDIDYISLSRHQLTYYLCMKLLFILYKPKAIFVTDHYSNYPLIKAAKDLKIKVIECQHGLISREHPAYNFDININSSYLPDFLLSFGDYIVNTLKDSRILDVTQIVPVGSLYLEYMREYYKPKTEIKSLFNNYKKVIGVTLQWTVENQLIDFIKKAAIMNEEICYVLIPRNKENSYENIALPRNVIINPCENFYEMILYADFHATVYSTCAIEAPSLGIKNIMINIDGLAKYWFGEILTNSLTTEYVNTPEEFVDLVNSNNNLISKEENMILNETIVKLNYKDNIRKFLENVLKEKSNDSHN